MFNMSDDSNGSVKLEGKKLVERGVHEDGKKPEAQKVSDSVIEDPELDINEETPALLEEAIEVEQEYFTDQEYGKESEREIDERVKKEMLAARQQQIEMAQKRQRGPQVEEQMTNPVKKVNEIEHSVLLSQNEGEPVKEVEQKQKDGAPTEKEAREEAVSLRKTDTAAVAFVLGENAKNLDYKDDQKLAKLDKQSPGAVSPTQLPDVRGKSQGIEI